MELHLLHPVAVHLPIVLLNLGLVLACLPRRWPCPVWAGEAAPWLLLWGTASAWAALGLGLLAERTAAHVPAAWETLADHETLAWWTVGLFTGLSAWQALVLRRGKGGRPARAAFLAVWALACGTLAATAHRGGRLVFTHGMGVAGR